MELFQNFMYLRIFLNTALRNLFYFYATACLNTPTCEKCPLYLNVFFVLLVAFYFEV